MFIKFDKKYDNVNEKLHIIRNEKDNIFNISIASSIRRSLYLTSHNYAINSILTIEQKKLFNNYFNTEFSDNERIYSVISENFFSKELFAHRLERIPLYLCKDTENILREGLYICLTDPDNYTKPFVNNNTEPLYIYTSTLKFLTINKDTDTIEEIDPELKKKLIKYDIPICILLKGNEIHILGNPVYDCGYEGSEFEPCCITYNFGENATPDYEKIDMFDTPKIINIIIEDNGKKDVHMALYDAINFLIYQLGNFKNEYNNSLIGISEIIKINNIEFNIQEIIIHDNNISDTHNKLYLADHTIGILISGQLIKYIMDLFNEYKEYNKDINILDLLTNTCISYVSPDESLLKRFIKINFQLSTEPDLLFFLSNKFKCDNELLEIKKIILNNLLDILIEYFEFQNL